MSMGARGNEITGWIVGKVILSYMEQRPARYASSKGPRTSATTSATHCSLVRADSPGGKVPLREFEDARKNLHTEDRVGQQGGMRGGCMGRSHQVLAAVEYSSRASRWDS